jgi:lipopolysaccharide transport system permease protein
LAEAAGGAVHSAETITIEPQRGLVRLELRELWRARELIGFLALRDVKVRYKQAALGVAWAVLQPLLTMLVFSLLFGFLMGADGRPSVEGVPYAVSTYCALVPWQLFATSLSFSGNSIVGNQNLVTKVYFPRLVLPIAPIVAALVDFAAAFGVLLLMMLAYGIAPGPELLLLPGFVALALATALAVSLWLSALNALYRDVRYALPFLIQLWFFVTPCVYTSQNVLGNAPDWAHWLYAANPMVGVVEGFRWVLIGGPAPALGALAASVGMVLLLLAGGAVYFRRMERVFADWV